MELQDKLNALRTGEPPVPMTRGQADAQALRLRVQYRMPYTEIAKVMGVYHGVWIGSDAWRWRLRQRGAPPSYQRLNWKNES